MWRPVDPQSTNLHKVEISDAVLDPGQGGAFRGGQLSQTLDEQLGQVHVPRHVQGLLASTGSRRRISVGNQSFVDHLKNESWRSVLSIIFQNHSDPLLQQTSKQAVFPIKSNQDEFKVASEKMREGYKAQFLLQL